MLTFWGDQIWSIKGLNNDNGYQSLVQAQDLSIASKVGLLVEIIQHVEG